MDISIASGKGGTGKTTVAVNLAYVWADDQQSRVHLVDCDVEAPNDHLFGDVSAAETQAVTLSKPIIDENKCTACGKCVKACNYNALTVVAKHVLLFEELCHSCKVCDYVCPENAISYASVEIGKIHNAKERLPLSLSWGELAVGQIQAPDIIRELRDKLDINSINILDSSPGCGCTVRETLSGVDVVILVTEPTPFGLNDLRLASELSLQLGLPTGIIINRSDGNDKIIEDFSQESGVPILGKIPFARKYAESYSKGQILAEQYPEIKTIMQDLCEKIQALAKTVPPKQNFLFESQTEISNLEFTASEPSNNVRQTVVISGKGGTGKTTICASLAALRSGYMFLTLTLTPPICQFYLKVKKSQHGNLLPGQKPLLITINVLNAEHAHNHVVLGQYAKAKTEVIKLLPKLAKDAAYVNLFVR